MLRTKDLFLFVACLFFLGLAVVTTLLSNNTKSDAAQRVAFSDTVNEVSGVEQAVPAIDRQEFIESLKAKLAQDDSSITPQASVASEMGNEEGASTSSTTPGVVTANSLVRCVYPDDVLPYIGQWPLRGIMMETTGGVRNFYTQETILLSSTASTTPLENTQFLKQNYLSLPLLPSKLSASSCVSSEVIGVTPTGILIFNSDVRSYRALSTDTLIGYARDGFPIYGVYTGQTDECGGYDSPTGYRYVITPGSEQILQCFTAAPQPFSF